MNWIGAAIFAISAFGAAVGLSTGRIPAKWPASAVERDSDPGTFWFYMAMYGVAASVGAIMILRSLI